jgi:dihydrofolate reductase
MRRVFLYMTVTFDGFLSGRHDELDWFKPGRDHEMNEDILGILDRADSLLMGYPTAPGMMAYWKEVGENKSSPKWMLDVAAAMNNKHVFVISSKKEDLNMDDAELVVAKNDKELTSAVNKIRKSEGGNICIPGGVRTAQNFSRLHLIDEYILMVHPVAIAQGEPLFINKMRLELVNCKSYDSGAVHMRYGPARAQQCLAKPLGRSSFIKLVEDRVNLNLLGLRTCDRIFPSFRLSGLLAQLGHAVSGERVLSSLDLVRETVHLLKVRLEGRGVPIRHSLQSWIEREHEVAERAAPIVLLLRL